MKALYGNLRATLIGLTAIMTLIAGLPHFRCQCPNGAVKPFCFGFCCSPSGCCCGNACAAADGRTRRATAHAGRRGMACCVHAGGQPTHGRSDGAPHVQTRGCVRTVAQQQKFVPCRPGTLERDHNAAGLVSILAACVSPGAVPTPAHACGLHLAAPPPSDLVIVLQRFLI